jgi:acyl-CoA synthetase (AMP-forming)/AMP-acid ligase II
MSKSLHARLYAQLETAPHRRALTFIDPQGGFAWQSLEQVYQRACAYGSKMQELGYRPGEVCLLVLPSNEFCAISVLAALLCGGAPLLMAPPILQEGSNSTLLQILKGILQRTNAQLVIAHETLEKNRDELQSMSPNTIFVFGEGCLASATAAAFSPVMPAENDAFALQLTSGTTGFPRICRWQQKNLLAALDGMALAMGVTREDICLNWTPLYHDMGLVNNFFLCLAYEIPLAMLSPIDFVKQPARWLRALHDTGATITWSPNFGYAITAQRVRDSEIEGVRLERVRSFWNAAERIHFETVAAFYERFARYGVRREALKMNFGCAENIGGATFTELDKPFVYERVDTQKLQTERLAQPVPENGYDEPAMWVVGAGRPHPYLEVKIVDEDGSFLPDGRVGEVMLETPSRMSEYLGEPEETRRAITGNLLRTGDLGYLRHGEFFWTGRVRERITIRGRKIDPSEFESILLKIPELRAGSFAAFGVDDLRQGTERIVLVSEVRAPVSKPYSEIAAEIQEQVNQDLGVPVSDIVLVRQGVLTKTSSGKRRHRHFRNLYLEGKIEFLFKSQGAV